MESQNPAQLCEPYGRSRTAWPALALLTISTLAACLHTAHRTCSDNPHHPSHRRCSPTEEKQSCLEEGKRQRAVISSREGRSRLHPALIQHQKATTRHSSPGSTHPTAIPMEQYQYPHAGRRPPTIKLAQQRAETSSRRALLDTRPSARTDNTSPLVLRPPEAGEDHPGRLLETPFNWPLRARRSVARHSLR